MRRNFVKTVVILHIILKEMNSKPAYKPAKPFHSLLGLGEGAKWIFFLESSNVFFFSNSRE